MLLATLVAESVMSPKKVRKGETVRRRLWANAGSRMGENLLRYKEPYMTWDRAEVRRWLLQWVLYIPGEVRIYEERSDEPPPRYLSE